MDRIDHLSWLVRPENIKGYVAQLEALFDAEFDHFHGPTLVGRDYEAYLSWDAGLELVAPLGTEGALAAHLTQLLDERGEGPFALVVGVPDVDAAADRARARGFPVGGQWQSPDPGARNAMLRGYTSKITDLREIPVGQFLGVLLVLGQVTYTGP